MAARLGARVSGLVQGVGYRYFVVRHARKLGLSGYVRNLADGSVEVEAEGGEPESRELLRLLEEGPPGAVVERLESEWGTPTGQYTSFDIKH
jgi:acylphosphatase